MFQLQLECAHLLYNDSSCVGSDIRIGTYCMYTYVEQTSYHPLTSPDYRHTEKNISCYSKHTFNQLDYVILGRLPDVCEFVP